MGCKKWQNNIVSSSANQIYQVKSGGLERLENSFAKQSMTDSDALIGEYDNTWLAINGNPIAYYHLSTVDNGDEYTITGYSAVYLNGQLSDLLITFDNNDPYGRIDGVRYKYDKDDENASEAAPVAKNAVLQDGDKLEFICDYYSYNGEFKDNYILGNSITVSGDLELTKVDIGDGANAAYCITDIYNESYWTPLING